MSARKVGAPDSKTRHALLEAATEVMMDEGYAAVTSRRVAARAGVNPALVHYYFPTMDELFLAVLRRGAEANLKRQQQALVSEQPLRALWTFSTGPFATRLMIEFHALANHRKDIRAEIALYSERFREIQQTALTFILRERGIDPHDLPPVLLSIMLASFATILATEQEVGVALGHAELLAFVDTLIEGIQPSTTRS